eukprot:TRINITY_DN4503_c0_g1_i1.p1 TRINITY_DN4503_c0_g1~~TRINITY_DN4503_c0_g1_i1.p1  ORF type:complete len:469 (+),score=171.62 TRINITY_DN4503_c0_g1_i1:68-1408(+)
MSLDRFVPKAMEHLQKACELDNEQKFTEALQEYQMAAENFVCAHKYEKDRTRKGMWATKAKELLDRAQQIKDYLDKCDKNESPTSPGGGAKGSGGAGKAGGGGGGGGGKKDEEDDKLKGALEGAIVKEKPNVKWDDIAGLEGAKDALREAVILPMCFPQLFTGKRKPWRGILMYGPPGTGKSYLAKAVATESDSTFFSISSSDIMSKWVGESEKLVRNLFNMARENKPAIIFVDEVDSMCGARGAGENESSQRVKTEFLVQMQGVGQDNNGILVLAATNLPWQLDSAIRRRFERRIEIPLPERRARLQMFKIHLGKTPHLLQGGDFDKLAGMTDMYSGSDINGVVMAALMEPVKTLQASQHFKEVTGPDPKNPAHSVPNRLIPCAAGDAGARPMTLMTCTENKELIMCPDVSYEDFLRAFRSIRPSVSKDDLKEHDKFTREFGQVA